MTRAEKLISYLYDIIDGIINDDTYQIKLDFLEDNINSYSLDKVPIEREVEHWVYGGGIYQDTYVFRSRFAYTSDQADQLNNIGFWEAFEKEIKDRNYIQELPDIEGIENIECLDCGSLSSADDNTCEMNIQVKITYREVDNENNKSQDRLSI